MTTAFQWPTGRCSAVMLGIAFDDGLDATARAPELPSREKSFSVWKYGAARGVERMLRCLEDAGLTATWFIPGHVAETHAALVAQIAAQGHEIACHGWATERFDQLTEGQCRELLVRARAALQSATGQSVTGFRLPFGHWPRGLAGLLGAAGFRWSNSLNGDDWPYIHPEGLVEIPSHIETEDRPYFQFNFSPAFPVGQSRIPSYDGVLANWIAEFEASRRYGLCLSTLFRPEWTGTPGRIGLMRALLAHMKGSGDAWFANGTQIEDWTRRQNPPLEPTHPLRVFNSYVTES